MNLPRPLSTTVASAPMTKAVAASAVEAMADAKATYLALRATGMEAFAAIEPAAQGDRAVAAQLWLEALRLVAIPAGKFKMGSTRGEAARFDNEGPRRQVTISRSLQMSAIQITQGSWEALMDSNPSHFRGDPALPVNRVSWDAICAPDGFLTRLNAVTEGAKPGRTQFRLPSEAEWEYACRAGTTTAYCFGNDPDALADYGWFGDNANGKPHQSGQKTPNAWGLHDLHGNVMEWCQDVWHDDYKGAPTDGSAWLEGGDQRNCVLRGGSWYFDATFARSAIRTGYSRDIRDSNIGFRVVLAGIDFPKT